MDGSFLRTALIFALIVGAFGFAFREDIENAIHSRRGSHSTPPIIQTTTPPDQAALRPVYERWKMSPLSDDLASDATIATAFKDLIASPCDKTAIFSLASELSRVGERRPAADALLGFARSCPNSEGEQYQAADILFGLGDYVGSIAVSDKLVELRPDNAQYYYMRGQALNYLGRYEDSTRDISSAIGLYPSVKDVNSEAFWLLASGYAALHRYCEAVTAIETYVYADVEKRDLATTRRRIDDYSSKGNCAAGYADGTEVVRRTNGGTISATIKINGVTGHFIVDTGASMVTMTSAFAEKAHVDPGSQTIMINTANGVSDAMLSSVGSIQLGRATARDVPAAILKQAVAPGIDGLLGMSFLARFNVAISSSELRLQPRNTHG